MKEAEIEVLGVYSLRVTEQLFRKQFEILYDCPMSNSERSQAERNCREQLSSIVLIEATVRNHDDRFDVRHFTQPQDSVPVGNWQGAWAEAYLTSDGQSLSVERWSEPPRTRDLRVAFFMHFWQPDKALYTSYGEVQCPSVQEMPERLERLVPYEPVD
jgi:hypothetical protein